MIIIDITLKGKYHKLRCTNNKEKADTTLNSKNSITLISIEKVTQHKFLLDQ